MALKHARPGTTVYAGPLGPGLSGARTSTLVNEPGLQIFRLILAAGQVFAEHRVPAGLVIQCLEGEIAFDSLDGEVHLGPGDLCHLPPEAPHSVRGLTAASALVTLHGERARSPETPYRSKESPS
jgi:quercetin dioxygenase-like cupin family protein